MMPGMKFILSLAVLLSLTSWSCSVPECSADEAEQGTCPEPAAGEGAPCATYSDCGVFLSCWPDKAGSGLRTCQYMLRPPLVVDAGAEQDAGDAGR